MLYANYHIICVLYQLSYNILHILFCITCSNSKTQRKCMCSLQCMNGRKCFKYFIIHTPFSNMKLINDLKMKWELKYEYIGNKEKGQILVQTTRYTNMNIYIDVKQYRNEKTTIL